MMGLLHTAGAYQIVTSRTEVKQGNGAAAAHVSWPLGSIPIEAAVALLKAKRGDLADADAEHIAGVLHQNALLLQLVGGFLRDGKIRPQVCPDLSFSVVCVSGCMFIVQHAQTVLHEHAHVLGCERS